MSSNRVTLTINSRKVTVPKTWTILEASEELKIPIPTLCYSGEVEKFTSCMLCVVQDTRTGRLVPACSAPAEEGMKIETDNERVRSARRAALEFLLSEHVGDCEAPCQKACPAHMNIPLMIRLIKNRNFDQALTTVKQDIALPAVLGRICSAPCEQGCRRRPYDQAVSICLLKRFVADIDLNRDNPYRPAIKSESGKRIAVVGAGPAGLSAAFYSIQDGHTVTVFDSHELPGGMLRYGVPEENLPHQVLEAEIEQIIGLGVNLRLGQSLGRDFRLSDLTRDFDAVVLAVGSLDSSTPDHPEIEWTARGVKIDPKTFETSVPGVFAGGSMVSPSRMAVRAAAHGKRIAVAVDQYLRLGQPLGQPRKFSSHIGKSREEDFPEFLKEAEDYARTVPAEKIDGGYTGREALRETARCFGCDCKKPATCRLRHYADEYEADQRRYFYGERKAVHRIIEHDLVIYEPGKCIKCGLCVRITKKHQENLGLTFVGRGFEVKVETPFHEPLKKGLEIAARECTDACPTGALAERDRNKESPT